MASKSYNPSIAIREFEEIQEFGSNWKQEWAMRNAYLVSHTTPEYPNDDSLTEFLQSTYDPSDPDKTSNCNIDIDNDIRGDIYSEDRKTNKSVMIKPLNPAPWFSARDNSSDGEVDVTMPLKNLSDFRRWWESLLNGHQAFGMALAIESSGIDEILKRPEDYSIRLSNDRRLHNFPAGKLTIWPAPIAPGFFYASIETPVTNFEVPGCGQYVIPVKQEGLLRLFPTWQTGTFRASFYDLDEAARNYSTLSFDGVAKLLSEDNTRGSEVFEAFGMKLPAGQITLWGDILILSVQLYFLVYLRQLSGKLKIDDAGWDVPWIGMNLSATSKAMCYLTFVILPAASVVCIGWQGSIRACIGYLYRTDHWYWFRLRSKPLTWHYSVLLEILLLVLAAFISGCLGLQCWKYRPKLFSDQSALPSCSPQRFE